MEAAIQRRTFYSYLETNTGGRDLPLNTLITDLHVKPLGTFSSPENIQPARETIRNALTSTLPKIRLESRAVTMAVVSATES